MCKTIFYLMLFSTTICCKSQQYKFSDLPGEQLIFGRGGGMTGAVDTYTLLENGQLFHSNSLTGANIELKKIGKEEAQMFFDKLTDLRLSEMNFNHPGNMYYFLEEISGETKNNVTWGSEDHEVSNDCEELYDLLRTTIK